MADILKEGVNMPQKLREVKQKKGRRGNNEGSIYQRSSDGRWCGSVTTGYNTNGKPIRKTVYGSSRQEVAKKIAAMTAKVFAEGYTAVSARAERNFGVLCEAWACSSGFQKSKKKKKALASITIANNRRLLRTHIISELGNYDIQDVTSTRLDEFFDTKSKVLAADTLRKLRSLLVNFFRDAVKKQYVSMNPMDEVEITYPESDPANTVKPLDENLRLKVFQEASKNPVINPILVTLVLTGLRPQELIVLTWDDINLDKRILSVKQALNRVVDFDDEGNEVSTGEIIGKTKTVYSVRTILLPEAVVTALKEWQAYCKDKGIVSDYVFPCTRKQERGKRRTYAGLRSLIDRFISSLGLDDENICMYSFRHTFATMLLEAREHPKIVASLMGHAKASTTLNIYSHIVSPDIYEETAKTLDGVYSKINTKQECSNYCSNLCSNADNFRQI